MPVDILISETINHMKSIGIETDNIDMNFLISGPNCIIESIIGVTLITELEEKINKEFGLKIDIFELITDMTNEDISLEFVAKYIEKKLD